VVSVLYEEEYFHNNDIVVQVIPDETAGNLTVKIFQIKFVPKMPVTVDVEIPGVSYTEKNGVVTFTGDDIVPLSGIIPVKRYLVTGLEGTLVDGECRFSLYFGDYPTTFSGTEMK